MEIADALSYVRARRMGVLVTQRRNGRPQPSNITYTVAGDRVAISVTDERAKTRNARRDPRVSLHVTADDFWSYVVLDGEATLLPVAEDPGDRTVDALVDYYRVLSGGHPNWDEYRAAMVRDRRTLLQITPTHAYGMLGA